MYACTQCDRKYASQNSLTRHVHNHKKAKKHRCSICDVVFYRKDLLSRHSRLHKPSLTEQSSTSEPLLGTEDGRKRCHTACIRCRTLRTKCNSQRPCMTCSMANVSCEYSRTSNRLSHLPSNSDL